MDPAVSSGAIHLEATARAIVPLSTGCRASLTLHASFDARATVAARPAVTGPALGGGSDAGNELALLFATPVLPAPTVPRATPLGASFCRRRAWRTPVAGWLGCRGSRRCRAPGPSP